MEKDRHYASCKIQPIAVMQADMTQEEFVGFLKGVLLKYILRMGKKGSAADDARKIYNYSSALVDALNNRLVDTSKFI